MALGYLAAVSMFEYMYVWMCIILDNLVIG